MDNNITKYEKDNDARLIIPLEEYYELHEDYRGTWCDPDRPEWLGKRTFMPPFAWYSVTCLLIEGESFVIKE